MIEFRKLKPCFKSGVELPSEVLHFGKTSPDFCEKKLKGKTAATAGKPGVCMQHCITLKTHVDEIRQNREVPTSLMCYSDDSKANAPIPHPMGSWVDISGKIDPKTKE